MAKTKVKFVLDTVSVRTPGSKYPTTLHKGAAWHADHPIVVDHPGLFSDEPTEILPRGWVPSVEQATAAPGEKRSTRRAGSSDAG